MAPTEKQMELLQFIVDFVCDNGFQPSQAEMAMMFGVTKGAVRDRLRRLEEMGVLSMSIAGRKVSERAIVLHGIKFEAKLEKQ